jgi:hypothetical protein
VFVIVPKWCTLKLDLSRGNKNRAGPGLGCREVGAALLRFVSPETLSLAATHGSAHCRGEEPRCWQSPGGCA